MNLDFDKGYTRKFCSSIDKFSRNVFVSKLIFPLLTTLPVALITPVVRSNNATQNSDLHEILKQISSLLTDHLIFAVFLAYLYTILAKFVLSAIRSHAETKYSINRDDLLLIEQLFSKVVESKNDRLFDYMKSNVGSHLMDAGEVFKAISKPENQIRLQTIALYEFMRHLDKRFKAGRGRLEVGIMRVKLGRPFEWIEFKDGNGGSPSLSPDELSQKGSTIMESISKRKPIFIHDIEKEYNKKNDKRRYIDHCKENVLPGSLICYPVKYGYNNEIPYVITIKVDVKRYFHPEDLYKWAIDRFISRIKLEHTVVILNEKSQ